MGHDKDKIKNLISILKNEKYKRIRNIPLRKYSFSSKLLFHEIFNMLRFFLCKRNLFGVSLFPGFYENVTKLFNKKLLLYYKLFVKNQQVELSRYYRLLFKNFNPYITKKGNIFRFNIRIIPFNNNVYITDPWDRNINGFTYLSYDSFLFCDLMKKNLKNKRFKNCLDICCGAGILGIELSSICNQVSGVEINKRAINYANINSYINSVPNIKFYNKDIFIYSDKNKFDLIIMNPPFLDDISCDESKPIDSYGGKEGLEFTIKVIKKIFKILKNKGEAHIITRTYIKYREDQLLKKIAVLMDLNKKFFEIDYTYLTKSAEKSTKGTSYKMIYLILKNNNRNKIKIKKGNYIFSLSHHF